MIVRIPASGQYEVPDEVVAELNAIDDLLTDAVARGDEEGVRVSLSDLVRRVREVGAPLPVEVLLPSDVVLPPPDSTLTEIRALLAEDGLIPG